jgi:lysophospholipase L1-like esterase
MKLAQATKRAQAMAGLVLFAAMLQAQAPNALLSSADMDKNCERAAQLMDAGGVAAPDLGRAAAPVIENVKQACTQLKLKANGGLPTYNLMSNVRAFLELSDAIPKPYPFPDIARQQLAELREISARLDAHFRALLDRKDSELVTGDPDDLARYADDNRRLGMPQAGKPRVVFLGDSITELWRLNEYFPDHDYINRGISGQTTLEMLGRFKADVIDLRPSTVVILGGTNDLARQVPLTQIEDNYLLMADLAAANRIKVIFASVLPVSDAHKDADPSYERTPSHQPVFIAALNEWLQRFAQSRGYGYVDFSKALMDAQGHFGAELSDDGLDPNSKGYRLMAPLLTAVVSKEAAAAAPPPVVHTVDKSRKGRERSK